MNEDAKKTPAVVVGVDGSEGSKEALQWALAEARLREIPLRLVHAWTYPTMGGFSTYSGSGFNISDLQKGAEELLEQVIGDISDAVKNIDIERRVIQDSAAAALLGEVAPGDLLVVGSRGHGGFASLLLGSVSQQCVSHASCPVVVVHMPNKVAHVAPVEELAAV
jgi:nucleotide-binding universal stress UspA family protein